VPCVGVLGIIIEWRRWGLHSTFVVKCNFKLNVSRNLAKLAMMVSITVFLLL
jgi:hypothetical protein